MRTSTEWLCDTPREPGCQRNAALTFICRVEGREIALCTSCHKVWRTYAKGDSALENRCPACAPVYVQRMVQTDMARAAAERRQMRVLPDDPVLAGPLAEVIDNAMFMEGVLLPSRRAVLARLRRLADTDDTGYVAMLLAQTQSLEAAG